MTDERARTPRTLLIADHLWETFSSMAAEMGGDREALINQALYTFARLNGFLLPADLQKLVPRSALTDSGRLRMAPSTLHRGPEGVARVRGRRAAPWLGRRAHAGRAAALVSASQCSRHHRHRHVYGLVLAVSDQAEQHLAQRVGAGHRRSVTAVTSTKP